MMRVHSWKILLSISIGVVVCAVVVVVQEEGLLHPGSAVTVFSVGQGDSIFVRSRADVRVLIDGGLEHTSVGKVGRILPVRDRHIDYLIVTHPHRDHIEGLIGIIETYPIRALVMTGVAYTSDTYVALLARAKEYQVPLLFIERPSHIEERDVRLEFLWPRESWRGRSVAHEDGSDSDGVNDTSIVTRMDLEGVSFLFSGDASSVVGRMIIQSDPDALDTDVVLLAHHGSDTANDSTWLAATSPKAALVSVGKQNQYHLPSLRVIRRVERIGVPVYRTDLDGDLTIQVREGEFEIKTEI